MLLRGLLPFLLFLTVSISEPGLEALSSITGLRIYEGQYHYLRGPVDVAVEARGKDACGWHYRVLGRWKDGLPVAIYVMEPEVRL